MKKAPFLFLVLAVTAQANPPPPAAQPADPAELASKIHAINQMEVRAGQLAKERGAATEVRRYGDRLVRDHQLADRMVISFARDQGITLGTPMPDPAEQAQMAQLQTQHGKDFDQHFLNVMDQGHTKAIQLLSQQQNRMPENSELRGLVTKLLPILRQHDRIAENLEKKAA